VGANESMYALWLLGFGTSVVLWQRASRRPVHRGCYCDKMYTEMSGKLCDLDAVGVHDNSSLYKRGRQRKGYVQFAH
jgi:hypothetical protein